MSAIGRVFIVLNLVLAGAFVGFAGTFLQRHTDYKERYEETQARLTEAEETHLAQITAKEDELRNAIRELDAVKRQLDNSVAENRALETENERLQSQLADLSTDVKTLSSNTTAMSRTIEQANQQSREAYTMAMEATAEKNSALSAREEAQTALSDAQRQIAQLENQLAENNSRIAALQEDVQEKDLLISMIRRKVPGVIDDVMPDLAGVVHQVSPEGRLVTVRVTDNPGEVPIRAGWTMGIYDEQDYKAEAVIESVEGDYAFCKITSRVEGATIRAGDRAATNIGE